MEVRRIWTVCLEFAEILVSCFFESIERSEIGVSRIFVFRSAMRNIGDRELRVELDFRVGSLEGE